MSRLKKTMMFAGSLLAVGGVAIGIVYAAIPSGNTITGCYGKIGGILRVIDTAKNQKCNSALEEPISWGQIGPQGIQGTQGIQGIQGIQGLKGDTGQSGLAAVYTNYGLGSLVSIGQGLTQTVASVTLPTGAYTLMGTTYVISGSDDTRFGQCFFAPGPPYVNGTFALAYVANNNPARLLVLGDVTVTSPQLVVYLRCYGFDGPIQAEGAIIATQVGSITPSS